MRCRVLMNVPGSVPSSLREEVRDGTIVGDRHGRAFWLQVTEKVLHNVEYRLVKVHVDGERKWRYFDHERVTVEFESN